MIVKANYSSDILGSIASSLCLVHCIATPFIFIAQSCSVDSCCSSSPFWWSAIDYLFIGITFAAVYQSAKHAHQSWLKYALYSSWVVLTALIINEKFGFIHLSELWKYSAAFGLISLHLYKMKFCKCAGDSCCATTTP